MSSATAIAHPNIAFIKYWGNQNDALRLPANGSISMTLGALETKTRVDFKQDLERDQLFINGSTVTGVALDRVSKVLDRVRKMSGLHHSARVKSKNNFPMGSGIASSASAFAALSMAASAAAGLSLSEEALSRLARTGSGSASRSIPRGFVEWQAGTTHQDSFAFSIADPGHWDVVDHVAVVSRAHKETGSTEGHRLAGTSPLQEARVADAPRRMDGCRKSILERDFETFSEIIELDAHMMHAVMMTSRPPLLYWAPETLRVMHAVGKWREEGVPVCYTIDAGPNVHVICPGEVSGKVEGRLRKIPGVKELLTSPPGGGARVLESPGDKV